VRRHDKQIFYRSEGKDSIRWDALSRRNYRALSAGRHFTKDLMSLAKDAIRERERRAYLPKKWEDRSSRSKVSSGELLGHPL